ncbi:MAG: flagellar hook-length control protein FliK [Phenylobacterium sp.]|nr:flagellar hook-length control protein FliK [Phenylobacterium sp.]
MSVGPTPPVGGPTQGPLVTGQAASAATAPTRLAQAPDPVATLLTRAVEAARADAAIRQAGMGSLLADLAPALMSATLPASLKAAIRQVLAFGLPAGAAADPAALKAAVARSGLFLEAQMARSPGAPPADMKAALLGLQSALIAAGAAAWARPSRAPAPPPSRNGSVAAQSPLAAVLGPEDPPDRQLLTLRDETEQALARQTLHQLASVPDETGGARWMFELPLLTPQGATIGQLAVERDDPGVGGETAPVWRARFALDIAPLGPVHVHLRLHEGRSAATLWVERPDSLDRLRGEAIDLARALGGEVAIHPGAPAAAPPPEPGHLVDRSS